MAVNTDQYQWKDISAVAGGRPVPGLIGIKYGEKVEREYIYARGDKPQAILDKNRSYEGEIKVLQSELEAFIRSSPAKSILDLTLDTLTVAYAPVGGLPTVDQLVNVKFMESFKEMNQSDSHMEVTLPIMFLDLKHDI